MKKKIIFIIPTLDPGGIETYLLRFLKFSQDEIETYIIVRNSEKGLLYEDYKSVSKELILCSLGYFDLIKMKKYFIFFKEINPRTVVDFNANFAGLSMFIANLAGIKNRITFYRQGKNHFKENFINNSYNRFVNNLVVNNSTSILSNSQAALDFFFPNKDPLDNRYLVIRNGINLKEYNKKVSKDKIRKELALPLNKIIIGHIGRFDKAKNHKLIISVANKFRENNIPVHFVLCGLNTGKLESHLVKLKLINDFTILGFRKDIPKVLKSFDLFFFPSITEGQPNALIEAMASGLIIVSSDIPAIKECLPQLNHLELQNPYDVDGFYNIIKSYIEKGVVLNDNLKNHASKYFDSTENFNNFLSKI